MVVARSFATAALLHRRLCRCQLRDVKLVGSATVRLDFLRRGLPSCSQTRTIGGAGKIPTPHLTSMLTGVAK